MDRSQVNLQIQKCDIKKYLNRFLSPTNGLLLFQNFKWDNLDKYLLIIKKIYEEIIPYINIRKKICLIMGIHCKNEL